LDVVENKISEQKHDIMILLVVWWGCFLQNCWHFYDVRM